MILVKLEPKSWLPSEQIILVANTAVSVTEGQVTWMMVFTRIGW